MACRQGWWTSPPGLASIEAVHWTVSSGQARTAQHELDQLPLSGDTIHFKNVNDKGALSATIRDRCDPAATRMNSRFRA